MFLIWTSIFTWSRTFYGLHFYPCDIFTLYDLVADHGHNSCLWSPGECPRKKSFLEKVLAVLTTYINFIFSVQSSGSRIPLLKFIPLWILRESSTIPILLTALLRPDVKWIGSAKYKYEFHSLFYTDCFFRIGFGGKAEKIKTCQNDDLQ